MAYPHGIARPSEQLWAGEATTTSIPPDQRRRSISPMPKLIRQNKCRRKCADTRRAPYAPVIADALRIMSGGVS